MRVLFIIGSPRSGTTLLEQILSCHPDIAEFYEPYYLWERFFDMEENDVWDRGRLTETIAGKIRREFARYAEKSGRPLILDKSPLHSFNIPIINEIFPEACWIHIVRDGRDVTLSIKKEWEKRKQMLEDKNLIAFLRTTWAMLQRQPFWRYKLMAITYELQRTFFYPPHRNLNKSRWKGSAGWGPRFPGWEEYLAAHSSLELNALQWVKSVEAVQNEWNRIPESNRMEIRYETLLNEPGKTITSVLKFLGYAAAPEFFAAIPRLKTGNTRKWETEFSRAEIETIKPILTPLLEKTGYLQACPWRDD